MRIGVTLPTFTADARAALDAAREAEALGLHGVFCFDHLWPIGHPERPSMSLYPTLGAVAAVTERVRIGSLVARVGLLPDEVVSASLQSLDLISGGRLIAGLGTGDDLSQPEHTRTGLPYFGRRARQEGLEKIVAELRLAGIECWVGAGRRSTNAAARDASAVLNYWGVAPEQIRRAAAEGPVTWGGPVPADVGEAASLLHELDESGSAWAVWGWPASLAAVQASADRAGIRLG